MRHHIKILIGAQIEIQKTQVLKREYFKKTGHLTFLDFLLFLTLYYTLWHSRRIQRHLIHQNQLVFDLILWRLIACLSRHFELFDTIYQGVYAALGQKRNVLCYCQGM